MLKFALRLVLSSVVFVSPLAFSQSAGSNSLHTNEYLYYEAEDMRGFATQSNGEPVLNPSWKDLRRSQAPGWGMNGTGTSAEWTQGGESGWNSAAASADETNATIFQDVEIPQTGTYRIWIRYADWANKKENFSLAVSQANHEVLHREFGTTDLVDPHDELSMYWQWVFVWDGVTAQLNKGPARLSLIIDKAAQARRHVDCFLITNDLKFIPDGRKQPEFAGMRYLREWSMNRPALASLLQPASQNRNPTLWQRRPIDGRDFMMPWNISTEFWKLYDKPIAERPLYPFNAEPVDLFIEKYKGARDVPIFASKLVVPVVYINNLPDYLKEGSPFLRYIRETKSPFAILINYGAAQMSDEDGRAAWKLLNGELKEQFLGWISGESVGHVWEQAPEHLKISGSLSRAELLDAYHSFYNDAIARKWSTTFHTETGAMWDKLIPAQSTSSTSFAHALSSWGVSLLGLETAAVQPMFAMRTAFIRGAAREFGGNFLYYHAPNFGDTATTFTRAQNFAGPDNFFHSRYGVTMGPSLSWYRKSYYFYYMSGASAIYLEQGGDQFFKPGPGEHDFQLNPLGRITDEFIKFAERHPNRGQPYTPIAFLLDPAHGWDMTDYPQWPFGVSQINRSDRALRELFSVAYYPGSVVQGEPASGDRQAFVNGIFGDIFDVIVAADAPAPAKAAKVVPIDTRKQTDPLYEGSDPQNDAQSQRRATVDYDALMHSYRAFVVGGHIDWTAAWAERITNYVRSGGTLVVNAAQVNGLPAELLGVRRNGNEGEDSTARCLFPGEPHQDLHGQMFRHEKIELAGATSLITTEGGDPLVTTNKVGKGLVVFCAVKDLLGEDERVTPFAAHMLAHVFTEAAPVKVTGDVEYLRNRNSDGWIVTLINNNGVYKSQQGMAQVDRSAVATAAITLSGQQITSALDWMTDKPLEITKAGLVVRIPPGGISIVELKSK